MNADSYFSGLSKALRAAEIHQPCLVLDLDLLDRNIAAIKAKFAHGVELMLVDKSLPSLPLLAHIRSAFPTQQFMTFHLPISASVLSEFPDADLVLGKPMPVAGARHALLKGVLSANAEQASRIVWLIDTDERLAAYGGLADDWPGSAYLLRSIYSHRRLRNPMRWRVRLRCSELSG